MARDLPAPDQLVPRQPGPQRSATLTLGAVLTAPGCGRDWTRAVLREWHQPDDLAETAEFLVSDSLNLSNCSYCCFVCLAGVDGGDSEVCHVAVLPGDLG